MAERRSLTDAVNLTPKLEAFITGGVPSESPQPVKNLTDDNPRALGPESVVEMPTRHEPRPRVRGRPRAKERSTNEEGDPRTVDRAAELLDDILVPLTTKLRRKTVQAIRRAYLEQKLAGRKPATQQEIIEEAVGDWLLRQGFWR